GETYGHHHRFGEMALAFALRALGREPGITLAGPAAFRARHPPAFEVEIAEATSWSCPHGVERWRADCGCRAGKEPGGSQAWRAPLRQAIDSLRDELAAVYEVRAGDVLRDPAGAIELGAALGARLEDGFLARLEPARANRDHETGVALYRRAARGAAATPARVAATAALLALHGEAAEVPGYTLRFSAGSA